MKIQKKNKLRGELTLPGDKSISHRSIILSAIGSEKNRISGFLESEDCLNTLNAFKIMGVDIKKIKRGEYVVNGVGLRGLKEPDRVINCGNSGTSMRIMTGLLAGQNFYSVLTGDSSLRQRPMGRIIDPLSEMGAKIWSRNKQYAPLSVKGQVLSGFDYKLPVASAQVKSSLLLAGLYAGDLCLTEPGPSRDHTERMLKAFGVPLAIEDYTIKLSVNNEIEIKTRDIEIPGDISSAAFFIAAGLITNNSEILLKKVGINPTRSGILDVLNKMKAEIEIIDKREVSGEPIADIQIKSTDLKATTVEGEVIPRLIDEIPIIAVLATQAQGKTIIRDAEELRVKETDRISAMVTELKKLGADIKELKDGMIINGPTKLKGNVNVESYNDHRVAMSLAIAGLLCENKVNIKNSQCIKTSFPDFFELLQSL